MRKTFRTTRELDEELAELQADSESYYELAKKEGRELTEAELSTIDEQMARFKYLNEEERPRVEQREQMRRVTQQQIITTGREHREAMLTPHQAIGPRAMTPMPMNQRLQAFRPEAFAGGMAEANEAARDVGHWMVAQFLGVPESIAYCRERPHLPLNNRDERMQQQVGDPTKGGYLVPEIVSRTILDIRDRYSLIAAIARQYPMQGETDHLTKRVDGLTVYKPGELSQIGTSEKTYSQVTLRAEDAYTLTYISHKLMRGSVVNAVDQVLNDISYSFAMQQDREGLLGDGNPGAPYYGITGLIPGLGAGGTLTASGGTWGDITHDDLNKLISLLPDKYHGRNNTSGLQGSQWATRSEALWICSRPFWAQVLEPILESGGGSNKIDLASPSPYMLKGYRVVFSDFMPTSSSLDEVCLLFGNAYDAMLLGQRENVGIFTSEHFRMDYDQLAVRGRIAYDINVHEPGDAVNPGAYVGLKTAAA